MRSFTCLLALAFTGLGLVSTGCNRPRRRRSAPQHRQGRRDSRYARQGRRWRKPPRSKTIRPAPANRPAGPHSRARSSSTASPQAGSDHCRQGCRSLRQASPLRRIGRSRAHRWAAKHVYLGPHAQGAGQSETRGAGRPRSRARQQELPLRAARHGDPNQRQTRDQELRSGRPQQQARSDQESRLQLDHPGRSTSRRSPAR